MLFGTGLGNVYEKLIILVGMFVATLTFAMLPFKLVGSTRLSAKSKKAVSFASCFSGGVFIAACLLDLFPDVHEAIDHVLDEIEDVYQTKIDYPVAEFVIVLGFFVVLILEQVVLDFKEKWDSEIVPPTTESNQIVEDESEPLLVNDNNTSRRRYGSAPTSAPTASADENASLSGLSSTASYNRQTSVQHPHDDEQHDHGHMDGIFQHSTFRSILLLIALSFHSVFEGLAIGLQQELGQLISLFMAVIIHKAVMAFSLGLTLAQSNLNFCQFVVGNLIFSAASPLGMGIGILLADMPHSLMGDIANGVLQGMAGGTFLYITFFEVLPQELNQPQNRMPKLLFVLLGYSCICGLLFITH